MTKFLREIILYGSIILMIHFIVGLVLGQVAKHYEEMNRDFHPRTRWNEFHNLKTNSVDLIFLGSSHCYRTFDPVVYDSVLNLNSFNLGSAIQTPLTSLFVLKEALVFQKPKFVVLEVYYRTFLDTDHRQYRSASYNFEFMKNSEVKFDFLLKSYGKDAFHILLPSNRYKRGLDYLLKGYKKNKKDKYVTKGYVTRSDSLDVNRIYQSAEFNFTPEILNPYQVSAFADIIKITQEEDIKLVLVTAPITDIMMTSNINYQDISAYFKSYAEPFGIEYIDYNFQNIGLSDTYHFYDYQHLNNSGAKVLNKDFSSRLKRILEN